jgi:hypothetical protein
MNMIDQTTKNRKSEAEWLAGDMLRDADALDVLADDVAAWKPGQFDLALGLIERAQRLVSNGERYVGHDLIGEHTSATIRNEGSIALGVTNGHSERGRGDMGYALIYALKVGFQYPVGGMLQADLNVKASSIRVYASTLRVVAQLCGDFASGKIRRVG